MQKRNEIGMHLVQLQDRLTDYKLRGSAFLKRWRGGEPQSDIYQNGQFTDISKNKCYNISAKELQNEVKIEVVGTDYINNEREVQNETNIEQLLHRLDDLKAEDSSSTIVKGKTKNLDYTMHIRKICLGSRKNQHDHMDVFKERRRRTKGDKRRADAVTHISSENTDKEEYVPLFWSDSSDSILLTDGEDDISDDECKISCNPIISKVTYVRSKERFYGKNQSTQQRRGCLRKNSSSSISSIETFDFYTSYDADSDSERNS